MKKTRILYWTLTVLFAGFMILSAIPDALLTEDAVKIVHDFPGFMLLPVSIGVLSYIYHHKLNALKLQSIKN